ncbi:ABC transporter permease [Alkalibacterium olivapovliticus]|uniref:Iron(III) transport system permease protein n=1 Tax=Alkalibacterium olivapovliticus TaxID=99907 RepID=A0A2T0W8Y9_9LACT|nr:iron ABC transporter permease [Alkalibacterium olivapovliticus]PRY82974.1 iron(III) transport system permease protein [Alkalibacterium olivapovliticus]
MMNSRLLKMKESNLLAKIPFYLFCLFIAWFIFALLIWPNVNVLVDIFWVDGELSLSAFGRLSGSNRAIRAILNSFLLATVLTVTVNIVGTFIVLVTEYFDIKGARILRVGFMSTLVFSGMVLNNGYLYVYGQNGVLTNIFTRILPNLEPTWFTGFPAVLFVMTFACTTNHMLFFRNGVKGLDNNTIEAAKNLGSSQWQVLKDVVFPTLFPIIMTLVIMSFQLGLGAMAAPIMVGGSFETISPLILSFTQRPSSRDLAALLSIILGIAQIILLVVMTRNEKKGNYMSISKTKTRVTKQKIENKVANIVVHALSYILFVIYTIPLILVILFSFMNLQGISQSTLSLDYFTLENYRAILTNNTNYGPLLTSAVYAGGAAVLAVLFMIMIARIVMKNKNNKLAEWTEYLFYIPWLLPGLMLALGLIISYDSPSFLLLGNSVIGSVWILPLVYLIMMLPSTLRYIKGAYYSFDNNLEDASRILGSSPIRTFLRIILPALLPTALALVALNFNNFLADYDLSAFLYHPAYPTIGITIRRNADAANNVNAAAVNLVYSVIIMAVSSIMFYVVYGRGSKMGEKKSGIRNSRRRIKAPVIVTGLGDTGVDDPATGEKA